MMVRCYWCISILIIIPTIKCCSLTGPLCGWSAVVLSDRRYPSFWNFDFTISIDVIRMKSYMDSLFEPTYVPVRVTINKLNFFPNREMPRFVSMFRNCGGLCTSKPYISVVFLRASCISFTKEMQEALNNLKQDDSIMILPVDKGRASVVLNTNAKINGVNGSNRKIRAVID